MMKKSADFRRSGGANKYDGDRRQIRKKGQKGINEAGDDEFDLVPGTKSSNLFKVVFDYYTPRPHFVILPREASELKALADYNQLAEFHKLDFVRTAKAMVDEYKLDGATLLSVHRGSWLSNKDMFHASVCVGVDQYIHVLHVKEQQIPDWPNKKYITKEWRASKNPRDFEKNVRGYPFKTYYNDELKSIREFITKGTVKVSINPPKTYEGYNLLYHSSEPRVGFSIVKSADEDSEAGYVRILDAMNKFAGENGLTDLGGRGDDKGCHICLVLGRSDHGKCFHLKVRPEVRFTRQTAFYMCGLRSIQELYHSNCRKSSLSPSMN